MNFIDMKELTYTPDNSPNFSYYKYMGSFTTPPCEQNIVWFVVSKPREIGEAASIMFKEKIKESF